MSLIKKIKKSLAERSLRSELRSRSRNRKSGMFGFDDMRTVGILFDAGSTEDFELVKRYVVYLREHRKKVKVIGYFSSKKIPDLTYSKLEYDFFSSKEVNWLGKPGTATVSNFISEEFDLLIDLNIHDHFPLRYIAAMSNATFKVGKYVEDDTDLYDMMIDSDNTKTLKYFLRQVDTYLVMLNKKEVSA
jgi:hypothetical protein